MFTSCCLHCRFAQTKQTKLLEFVHPLNVPLHRLCWRPCNFTLIYTIQPPAGLQDIPTCQRLFFPQISPESKEQHRLTFFSFSLGHFLSRLKDNCDKTSEKQPDVLSLFEKQKKSKVRNLKRALCCQCSSLSSLVPLFLS